MTKLAAWMTKNGWSDAKVADEIGISRVQVSRIRRGLTGATPATARKLQELTGIRWHDLIEKPSQKPTKQRKVA